MKTCEHCGKDCARRVPAMHKGKLCMVGTGCVKKLKRVNRSDFFNANSSLADSKLEEYFKDPVISKRLEMVQSNVKNLGLEDRNVVPVLGFIDGPKVDIQSMLMSEASCLKTYVVAKVLGYDKNNIRDTEYNINIKIDNKVIGYVDSDGVIELYTANVRETLGWAFATDGGSVISINVDIDKISQALISVVKHEGVGEDVFFGTFRSVLEKNFSPTSRFGDCSHILTPLWISATREIGKEHLGYPFGY